MCDLDNQNLYNFGLSRETHRLKKNFYSPVSNAAAPNFKTAQISKNFDSTKAGVYYGFAFRYFGKFKKDAVCAVKLIKLYFL